MLAGWLACLIFQQKVSSDLTLSFDLLPVGTVSPYASFTKQNYLFLDSAFRLHVFGTLSMQIYDSAILGDVLRETLQFMN